MKNNKKNKTIILIIFSILSIILFSSIVYSAFSSTMNITGTAHARVEANVRITKFSLSSKTNNATSSYEEFGKDTISTGVSLPNNSSITYEIEVTNYGTTNVGIFDITGLPTNLTYSLSGYKLKDKLCDTSNKCNTLSKTKFNITISNNNTTTSVNTSLILKFNFQMFHTITYTNITNNNYPTEIINGETLKVNLSSNPPLIVGARYPSSTATSTYKNNIITIENVTGNLEIEGAYTIEYSYNYKGASQTFKTPHRGIYKVELWGASGGGSYGAAGGYTKGNIQINKNKNLYVYVGQTGIGDYYEYGGYNGGGSHNYPDNEYTATVNCGTGGGGATDIRLTSGTWNNFDSLKSRIMVAAGGGGSTGTKFATNSQGFAGGLKGYDAPGNDALCGSTGGFQTGKGYPNCAAAANDGHSGFGYGGTYSILESAFYSGGGGGSGYYGGGSGFPVAVYDFQVPIEGTGGSSFISGHNGCDAIKESSTQNNIIHTGQSVHYSGYKFTSTIMIDGAGYNWTTSKGAYTGMPSHNGTSTMTGNIGNGYAKITLLEIN